MPGSEVALPAPSPSPDGEAPAPVRVREPVAAEAPIVFATPHSGRLYPADMMADAALSPLEMRRSEDAFVDDLIGRAPEFGVAVVEAVYARAYVDLNRDPLELDPVLIADPLPAHARTQTARVAAGLGAVARVVGEGREIYRRKLPYAEAERRIAEIHQPYHQALADRIQAVKARHGVCVLVDWHSMPSAAARAEARRGRPRPDMVLGDRHGQSCSRSLTNAIRRRLEASGYAVGVNSPYAGGWTTQTYGRPREGVHAIQIELDRRLYLDEARLEPGSGFDGLRADLERLIEALARGDWRVVL
jgi:N-formylglutamate amidohydrolase